MPRIEMVLAGVALAVPYVLYARSVRDRARVFGAGLVIAALVYVVFAVSAGTTRDLLLESGGGVLFAIVAVVGVRYSRYLLALGWAAHVGWDLLLHPAGAASYAPWWYPVTCIGFDLVVAASIIASRAAAPRPRRRA